MGKQNNINTRIENNKTQQKQYNKLRYLILCARRVSCTMFIRYRLETQTTYVYENKKKRGPKHYFQNREKLPMPDGER